jgi:hypothetical protein
LRDLIYRRFETGLAAVFVSRRTLRNIEQQLADVSTLDNVCEQFCVRPFDEGALWLLADRCRDEWQIVEQDKRQLVWYSGGHPYIAEMILCHALPTRSIRAGCDAVIASIFEYYQHLQRLLEEDGLFEQLLQIVVGPRWSIRPGSLELLQRYGIVRLTTTEPSRYEGWSQHFQLYLEKCARESVLWALWRDTESAIREHIQEVCERAYGQDWIETLVSRHGSVAKILGECRAKRKKEESNFGLAASLNVLDYSYPMDLWCILSCEWDLFRRIFQKEKRYWSDRFAHLSKVRTPTAHSREIVIPDHEVVLAQAYCKEILMLLRGGSQAEDVRADVAALD